LWNRQGKFIDAIIVPQNPSATGEYMERIIKELEEWVEYMKLYSDKQYQKGKIKNLLEYAKTKQNTEE